jgi:hypothetical protein
MRPHASLVVVELSVVLLLAGAAVGLAGQRAAPNTLTRPVSTEKPVAADGFIQRWSPHAEEGAERRACGGHQRWRSHRLLRAVPRRERAADA